MSPEQVRILGELGRLAGACRQGVARRDDLIREAHRLGCPLRVVGEAVGMSHSGVLKVIRRGVSG